jgi:broad specificity phosphatase PhoE
MARARLIVVRHGETEGESSIRYHGANDVALSELGRAQMRAARDAIAREHGGLDFVRTFTTPLVRASESAAIIAGSRAPVITIEEFAEVHFGRFEGLTAAEIEARYPSDFARWNANRLDDTYTYPEGESRAAFAARVERGVKRMLREIPDTGTALVVAHRGVIRAIVKKMTGAESSVELGSISVLEFETAWRAIAIGLTGHLQLVSGA